ncbi:hypothetical protein EYF80_033627 [Liparis tanakae]|uniref:Uncharacterized protein n=1 Tax=Liparis tanakae TaxID=230148 RepID=A0A4Z2GTV8_9TELE|nr:hypothetical protein EYF80_033627 [Liparis tanakae]
MSGEVTVSASARQSPSKWNTAVAPEVAPNVLRLLLSRQLCVPLVRCCLCRHGHGGGLDLLGAVLVWRWRLGGGHRLKQQGRLLLLLLRLLLLLEKSLQRHTARLRSALLQDLLRSAQRLAHVEDLAHFEYGVYFTGAWEERPEGIQLCHDAADCPLVYG